jgi:hypothetical protein
MKMNFQEGEYRILSRPVEFFRPSGFFAEGSDPWRAVNSGEFRDSHPE